MSIRKLPQPDGTNHYVIDYRDPQHKRVQIVAKEGERYLNLKETQKKYRELLNSIGKGTYVPPDSGKITFNELTEMWIASRDGKIRPVTLQGYKAHLEEHLKPFFGPIQIGRIQPGMIDAYMADRKAQEKPIGVQTLNKTLTTLGSILKYAIRLNLLAANPVSKVERPKVSVNEQTAEDEAKTRIHILTKAQIPLLLAEVEDRTLILLALLTGCRQSEILGLRWSDILWTDSQIWVQRAVSNGRFYAPKNASSRRKIDVAEELLHELKVWRMAQQNSAEDDLVFPGIDSKPLDRTRLTKRFGAALRRAKLPALRFHDLRHTYASLLIAAGCNIKYIQAQLGHKSAQMTLDVYGHLLPERDGKAVKVLTESVLNYELQAKKTQT